MRILVTGTQGQVAQSLLEIGPRHGHQIVAIGRPELDLAGEPEAIVAAIMQAAPSAIISAAAYTAVDLAESEPDVAHATNARGAGAVARAAAMLGVPMVHLSTDYVFDGTHTSPYVEDDVAHPAGTYGASKLAGEQAVLREHADVAVLRCAWVYSPFGRNFVTTMLRLAADRNEIGVVSDQFGNPTSALDIADASLKVLAGMTTHADPERRGIIHMTGQGETSWAGLAEEVFAVSKRLGGPSASVRRIATAEYPTPAPRPANSRLDNARLQRTYGIILPRWQTSLATVVERLAG